MNRILKIILISLGSLVVVFVIIFGIYLLLNIQGKAESYEVNSPDNEFSLLIATQGSPFKDALLQSIITETQDNSLYIKVLDVHELETQNPEDWNGLIIIHTVERFDMQKDVRKFLNSRKDFSDILLITTSGSGEWKTDQFDVDVITSASKKDEIPQIIEQIKQKYEFMND